MQVLQIAAVVNSGHVQLPTGQLKLTLLDVENMATKVAVVMPASTS